MDPGVGLDGCCVSFLIWYPMVLFYDPPRDLLNRIQWVQQFRGCPKHGFPPVWYTDDSEALLGILSGGCADEWGSAAPGEAPPVISAHVEQWAAHPALPSPNKESKGAASSTGVLTWWNWEIWNRTLSNGKRGAWTLPKEVGDKEGRWEGQAGNSF